ncbi:hypothetical protein BC936DRAFT_146705 [Jimgerdemannia flammicorona]|uniref:peptidylprolyl isomerase n=1 Tax=Jimgerdemannia flammicorona TaxID=994334 RepID=A0A433D6Y1_9FUNG|nr:hypothetical protein BC936DRAFT_146705 [Jimgerdemannia flammicorona]
MFHRQICKKPKKQTLPNGLVIEDIKIGTGPKAKAGKKIGMRYIGRLTNGKVFDKNVNGKPFHFNLGKGEVIKGWDIGIAGMQLGGERKLTIPATLAYGSQGSPPDIPKNATLEFEVVPAAMSDRGIDLTLTFKFSLHLAAAGAVKIKTDHQSFAIDGLQSRTGAAHGVHRLGI